MAKWRITIPIPEGLEAKIRQEAKDSGVSMTAVILSRLARGYENDPVYINHVNRQLTTAQMEDSENE